MADKKKFERKKPHCNIGTIGHVDHDPRVLLYQYYNAVFFSQIFFCQPSFYPF